MGGSSDDGLFEFDQLSDSADDPPDEPDPPDDDTDSPDDDAESAPTSGDGESGTSASTADEEGDGHDPSDPPDDGGPSAEPTAKTSAREGETSAGATSTADTSSDGGNSSDEESSSDDESSSGNDAPDPPDPSDSEGSDSGFYDIDPVDDSQKAFQFAEEQSRAAAETAYKRAADSLLGRFIKKYTSPEVRERLDEVFSRRMLGSVFVGGAFSKILETSIEVYFGASSLWRPFTWLIIFTLSTTIFVWWDHLSQRASEAAEKASETAEKATEAASEAAEKASETAEKASEAASEATGAGPEPEEKTASVVGAGIAQATQKRGEGATAATRAGGRRPTAVRSRSRAPERRPNKRFEGERERVPYGEVVGDVGEGTPSGSQSSSDDAAEPAFESGGFKDPGDAEEF